MKQLPPCPIPQGTDRWRYLNFLGLPGDQTGQLPMKQAKVIAKNLLDGKPYYIASPMYRLERQELAIIHVHARTILAMQ